MQRERVTDDIYIFTSELYAQVTAGVIVTDHGVVVVDTLAYPNETRQIKQFITERLQRDVRYVVNSHFHADHTLGTCLFPEAQVIAHQNCYELLDVRGRESLRNARENTLELQDVTLVLPDIVFDKSLTLYLGNKTLKLSASLGHSLDSIICHVVEDQVLFAADTIMPIPYFVDGDYKQFLVSLQNLNDGDYEHVIQGHGEVILKGEIREKLQSDTQYLLKLEENVKQALQAEFVEQALNNISIESCGKSRILLNGTAGQLHRQNVIKLAEMLQNVATDE